MLGLNTLSRVRICNAKTHRFYATSPTKRVVVVGGGCAGLAVLSQVGAKLANTCTLTLIEPSENHYYQPGWTLVGAGILNRSDTVKEEAKFVYPRTNWIKDRVATFNPENNNVTLESGQVVDYDFLVVAAGIQINWSKINGFNEYKGKDGVCSNYSFETVQYTRDFVANFKGGNAIFTHPTTPVKCAGASQKIMYLAEEIWREADVNANIKYFSGMGAIFPCPHYVPPLLEVCKKKNIKLNLKHELVEIRGDKRQAVFKNLETNQEVIETYDFLHVTPPMGPPDFIAKSPLADVNGWLAVNKETLRSDKYSNVYGLGDCSNLPTSKTAAAISAQAPILVENLVKNANEAYDGYTSCPLITGKKKLILAEFSGYDMKPRESLWYDQRIESPYAYWLKISAFPFIYWGGLLSGLWKGPSNSRLLKVLKSLLTKKAKE